MASRGKGGNSTAARRARKYRRNARGQFGGGPSALGVGKGSGPVKRALAKRIRKPAAKRARTSVKVGARAGTVKVPGVVEVRNARAKVNVTRNKKVGKAAVKRK
jgi:hypothetical protein